MKRARLPIAAALLGASAFAATAQDLTIALQSDPDTLDPDPNRSFVGRIVLAALCDKLVDISPELDIVPQLATDWTWSDDESAITFQLREDVTFHDGTPFDAEAVKWNIERSQNLDVSQRKTEIETIASVEVVGPHEVRFDLTSPDAALLAQLTDRAGMMISPSAAKDAGEDFGLAPVCSGPFTFENRVAQDRIELARYDDYWNADEIHFDSVTYLPIPDTTVRLANLLAGDVDIIERLAATDLEQARQDPQVNVELITSLGYQGLTFNLANGPQGDEPWGSDKRLRQALNLSIDREALNQVVFDGAFAGAIQPFDPSSPWFDEATPVPERDIEAARALLAEAGYPDGITLEAQVPNSTEAQQVMQVVQAMASEAGIRIELVSKEFATILADQARGAFTASQIGWSGRIDPDGNLATFLNSEGGLNDSGFGTEEVDALLAQARETSDREERKALYDQVQAIANDELPIVYLYHRAWVYALDDAIEGFVPYPDGIIRLEGIRRTE
ncbi:ABC transporter substrate-binding protein [Palleronia sp. LCG004]|uniref:ABC transporter substrate-binding protein n=1 Tax=Palleronia sp. LCG004 TaxID=3079304 RepID=UPI00294273EF|nr:ABC transporter substrate-binding protein [Palleronia sp. LCG004]WOI55901.1 ABC transporter substrate-binding protein [Palleronia sp. LCG004]